MAALHVTILSDVHVSPPAYAGERWAWAFPNACRLAGCAILVACRRGKEKHSRDGAFVVMRSDDDGLTWSEPLTLHAGPAGEAGESVHAGTVCDADDGSVVAMFTAVEVGNGDGAYIFSEAGRTLEQKFYVAYSSDGGRSWSAPALATLPGTPPLRYINSRPLPLPGGRLLVPLEITTDRATQAVMAGIYDVAAGTFFQFAMVADDPAGRLSFGDPKLVRRADGSLLMVLWAFVNETEETVEVHVCISLDDGTTWTAPQPTAIRCQAAALLRTGHGILLAGNVRTPPEGIRLWHSADGGDSWSGDPIQMWDARSQAMLAAPLDERSDHGDPSDGQLWAALPGFTFGSPDLVPTDGGGVLTYYAVTDGFAEVRACRFTV